LPELRKRRDCKGEGDKQNRFGGTKETFDLLLDVIEIAATIKGGIADE
jgi:hypothetical protein